MAHRELIGDDALASAIPAGLLREPALIGIGIDAVDIDRFEVVLSRTPSVSDRIFTGSERTDGDGHPRSTRSLAVRFAAKEAVMKVLGVGIFGVPLAQIEVIGGGSAAPALALTGRAHHAAEAASISRWQVSLTHTDHIAIAVAAGLS